MKRTLLAQSILALPWMLAVAYLFAIAHLGWQFSTIEQYKVDQVRQETGNDQWQVVNLNLFKRLQPGVKKARYQLSFDLAESAQQALFLTRFTSDINISLNDHPIHQVHITRAERHTYKPLLVPLPEQYLRPTKNQISLEIIAHHSTVVLAQFYLGPQDKIEPIYLDFHFWRTDLMWSAFIATLLLAIFMGTIWLVRRQLHEYGWIALAFFAYLLFLNSFIRDTEPINYDLYSWSFLLGRTVFLLSFMLFIHRFLNINRLTLERSLIIFYILLYSSGLLLISIGHFLWFRAAVLLLIAPVELILLGYFAFVTFIALRKNNTSYMHWFFSGSVIGFAFGIHDLLVILSVKHWLIQDFYISQYAVIFVVLGYGGVMVHRIARALLNSEELNEELSLQLALKTEDLKREGELRLAHQKKLALAEERQRILADMHDGVGGQLTTLLAASRQSNGKKQANENSFTMELEQIIADLRLVLDTMSPSGEELIATLARLRERYQPLFRQAGINLHWSISHQIEEIPLPPSQVINVLRFVQEALQNVVKHAHADEAEFQLTINDNQVLITINDNGNGSSQEKTGYGLHTMRLRAQRLAGSFTTAKKLPSGLSVQLQFPLPEYR